MCDEDLIGKRFGEWEVLREVEDERPGRYFECICSCGKVQNVHYVSMKLGRSKKCWDCGRVKTGKADEMLGKKVGKWTVLYVSGRSFKSFKYMCVCECGVHKEVHGPHLRQNKTSMCRDCSNRIKSKNNCIHGYSGSSTYKIWSQILQRCNNPKTPHYNRYGGRGISVCERWKDFKAFLNDMGERPPNMDIDRIDNDGNYEPSNCRWISHKENCRNTSRKKTSKA